jgi:beta-galactosidase/beta-glucuronidase
VYSRVQHPRPQLTRAAWTDLGGTWDFAYDDDDRGLSERWNECTDVFDREIVVPFPPESPLSGIGDPSLRHRVVWYHRTLEIPLEERHLRWLVHFGAVDYRASVWLNGKLAVTHEGGHSTFTADITDLLDPARSEQHLMVRAEDDATDLSQPRGKQYWKDEPGEIWYQRTTGIWLPVWLEPVPQTFIRDVRWTADLVRGRIGVTVTLNRVPTRSLRVRVKLTLRDRCMADDEYGIDGIETRREIGFDVPNMTIDRKALYWTPEFPNLVDAELTLIDDEPIDRVESYLGLRSVAIKDGFFMLNERPYYQRLALAQGYWPESHLAAPSAEAIRREVEFAKACGLNGLRLHQKVEDPRYLYWCDRIGLLVWGEMANAYAFSVTAVERFTQEWLDVVRRDVSHPCIVAWLPINESWGVPNLESDPAQRHYVQALYHLTHALDPSRPVIGNDGWELFASDIWGIHDYELDSAVLIERYGSEDAIEQSLRTIRPYYQALAFPEYRRDGQPVLLTEIGGIFYEPDEGPDAPEHGRRAHTEAEWLARFTELMNTVFAMPTVRGFCYTQLTDTEGEINGFLTADRRPKLDPAVIRSILRQPARSMPAEMTFGSAIGPAE